MKKPILTVMPDYGMGPFLWFKRQGDDSGGIGGNCCDVTGTCGKHPLSPQLHADFAAWVTEFERFPVDCITGKTDAGVDWESFHARGLELARRLKAEVGDEYRVIYVKPIEDPGHGIEGRREVHADGRLTVLPSRYSHDDFLPE